MKMFGKGWYNDNWRHSLAAKGIRTSMFQRRNNFYTTYNEVIAQLEKKKKDLEMKVEALEEDEAKVENIDARNERMDEWKADSIKELENRKNFFKQKIGGLDKQLEENKKAIERDVESKIDIYWEKMAKEKKPVEGVA